MAYTQGVLGIGGGYTYLGIEGSFGVGRFDWVVSRSLYLTVTLITKRLIQRFFSYVLCLATLVFRPSFLYYVTSR